MGAEWGLDIRAGVERIMSIAHAASVASAAGYEQHPTASMPNHTSTDQTLGLASASSTGSDSCMVLSATKELDTPSRDASLLRGAGRSMEAANGMWSVEEPDSLFSAAVC